MKFFRFFVGLSIFAFARFAMGAPEDTMELAGPTAGYAIGWFGEAWKGQAWCGDTLIRDTHPDTSFAKPDTEKNVNTNLYPVRDTVLLDSSKDVKDTLVVMTRTVTTKTVLRQNPTDTIVNIVNVARTIIDSNVINICSIGLGDFMADTGGFSPGATYLNYYYKYRNYWAQLPILWNGWGGKDSETVSPFKTLLVTYKGILPQHQLNLEFYYASWGAKPAIDKGALKMGDGVGILLPTTTWKTVIIQIPDSVSLPGITGLNFRIENVPGSGGKTSELGNIKLARVALIKPPTAIRSMAVHHGLQSDRLYFTPKIAGAVAVSLYSFKGELLCAKSLFVNPDKKYSVRGLAARFGGAASAQVRIVKIQGAGVNVSEKIW